MNFKKEFPLWIIILLPFIYLAYIWNGLPETVPTHWNASGEIDGYSSKSMLILIPILLPLLVYVILTLAPKIDPKKKIDNKGKKYSNIKLLLTLFMSALSLFILYSSKSQTVTNPNIIFLLIGLLFTILGNFMKTFKPNYFIGIRTPWTLENETVWKKTHELGGKIWFVGGLLIVCLSLILSKQTNATVFILTTTIMALVPIIYSYLEFKKLK
ncbi:SdpI family protein [Olleya sp. R77988]|uniref:SdpI family protein n=1 Tax=Olleya sp. R77988 TaxID=3093875 RepID=UPI0037C87163